MSGPTHHAGWECVHHFPRYANTQVAVYVSRHILFDYYISFDPLESPDANLLILRLTRVLDGNVSTLVCLYNPPATNNSSVFALLTLLCGHRLEPTLLQGDFNLHHEEWDPHTTSTSIISHDLLNELTLAGLTLVNNDSAAT